MTLIVLLLTTAVALRLVGGQEQFPYQVATHFHQYSNPTSTIYDRTCCDSSIRCLTECNTLLQLCYRIGETSHDSLDCPAGLFILGSVGGDNVAFTDTVGDFKNPVVIPTNILPPSGYQLLIQSLSIGITQIIYLVDNVFIEIPVSTLEGPSPPTIYYGEYHENIPVTINLSYSLDCSPNFTLCTVNTVLQCVPEDECIDGSESLSMLVPQTAIEVFTDYTPFAYEEFLPTFTHKVQKESVSVASTSAPIVSSIITTPTSNTTPASGTSLALIFTFSGTVLVIIVIMVILLAVGMVLLVKRRNKTNKKTTTQCL